MLRIGTTVCFSLVHTAYRRLVHNNYERMHECRTANDLPSNRHSLAFSLENIVIIQGTPLYIRSALSSHASYSVKNVLRGRWKVAIYLLADEHSLWCGAGRESPTKRYKLSLISRRCVLRKDASERRKRPSTARLTLNERSKFTGNLFKVFTTIVTSTCAKMKERRHAFPSEASVWNHFSNSTRWQKQ